LLKFKPFLNISHTECNLHIAHNLFSHLLTQGTHVLWAHLLNLCTNETPEILSWLPRHYLPSLGIMVKIFKTISSQTCHNSQQFP